MSYKFSDGDIKHLKERIEESLIRVLITKHCTAEDMPDGIDRNAKVIHTAQHTTNVEYQVSFDIKGVVERFRPSEWARSVYDWWGHIAELPGEGYAVNVDTVILRTRLIKDGLESFTTSCISIILSFQKKALSYKEKSVVLLKLEHQKKDILAKASDEYHAMMRSGAFHPSQTLGDWIKSVQECEARSGNILDLLEKASAVFTEINDLETS